MTSDEKKAYRAKLIALGTAKKHSKEGVEAFGRWTCCCPECTLVRRELPKAAAKLGGGAEGVRGEGKLLATVRDVNGDIIRWEAADPKEKQPKKPKSDNDFERFVEQHFGKLCRSPREKQLARVTYLKAKAMLSKGWVQGKTWKHYYQELEKLEAMK